MSQSLSPGLRLALFTFIMLVILAVNAVLFIDFLPSPLGGYADQRLLLAALIGPLLVIFSAIIFLTNRSILSKNIRDLIPGLILSIVFVVLVLPFARQSYVWVEPGMFAFYFLTMCVSGLALARSHNSVKFTIRFSVLAAAGCFLYGAMSINVYLFALSDNVANLVNFLPWGFVNIRYWSHIATWLLPLLPLAVLVGPLGKHRLWRLMVAIGAGLWWWILFMSSSRGSMLGIVFGVVLVFVLLGRTAYPWVKVFLQHLLVGIAFWVVLSLIIPSFVVDELHVRSLKTDSSGRMPLFIEAWHMSLQNFPFGMGPQSWLTHEVITSTYANSKKLGHPHNMYLMWAAEYGWILIAALAGLIVQAIRSFWRARGVYKRDEDNTRALLLSGYTASVSAALLHAGVSAVFMAPGSMLIGLFVLIGFWALIQPGLGLNDNSSAVVASSKLRKKHGFLAMLVLCVILVGWLAWLREVWVYYEDMRLDEEHYSSEVGEGILPRFWFHGNFPREVLESGSQELNKVP